MMHEKRSLLNRSVKVQVPILNENELEGDTTVASSFVKRNSESNETATIKPVANRVHLSRVLYFLFPAVIIVVVGYLLFSYLNRPPLVDVETVIYADNNIEQSTAMSRLEPLFPDLPKVITADTLAPLTVDAKAYALFDVETYRDYGNLNQNEKLQIASLTKLMTALIVYDTADLDGYLKYNKDLPDDLEYLFEWDRGDSISVEEGITTMLVSSYNDVAFMFAANYEDGGYQGFIEEMNRRAEAYGMINTRFANSYGFDDPNNYSTVADLKILVNQFLKNDYLTELTQIGGYNVTVFSAFDVPRVEQIYSTNQLIGRDNRVKGLKTGSTELARYCFVGYFEMPDGQKLGTIILGSESDRFQESLKLIQYRVDNFE